MGMDAIIRELQARVGALERDARLVRKDGGSGGACTGEVWFPSGAIVTGMMSDSSKRYIAVHLHNETVEQVAVMVSPRPDGILYYDKKHTHGHIYVPLT